MDDSDIADKPIRIHIHMRYMKPFINYGLDHITAEHLKSASLRLAPLLVLCFTGFIIHVILPDSMLCILLVSVIKDKAGKVSCLDNYKPVFHLRF